MVSPGMAMRGLARLVLAVVATREPAHRVWSWQGCHGTAVLGAVVIGWVPHFLASSGSADWAWHGIAGSANYRLGAVGLGCHGPLVFGGCVMVALGCRGADRVGEVWWGTVFQRRALPPRLGLVRLCGLR